MIKKIFTEIQNSLLDFIYPPKCPICDAYIENRDDILCEECEEKILAVDHSPKKNDPIKEVWRITKYREGTREIIRDLKFNFNFKTLKAINKILKKAINESEQLNELLSKIDIAVAIPLYIDREKERGFNQVELIFGEFLKRQNISMERLIIRNRSTDHLYKLSPEERKTELVGAFSLVEGANEKIINKKILLLDDIFTTGTTMKECTKVFSENGVAEIYGLALASDY